MRDGAVERPDQRGEACVLCLKRKCQPPQKARPKPLDLTSCVSNTRTFPLRTEGAAAAAAAAAVVVVAVVAVAVTPVLGRLALVVPHGGVERLKRDIAPLSATQLVALLREAGADDC